MKAQLEVERARGSESRAWQSGIRARVVHSDEQLAAMVAARECASRTVQELTIALADDLDYTTVLRHVARALGSRLAAACIVDLVGADSIRIAHAPTLVEPELSTILRPLAASVHASGASILPGDRHAAHAAHQLGAQSVVVVPLVAGDETVGSMTLVGDATRPLALSVEEAEVLGGRMGSAIRNGRRYEAAVAEATMREDVMSIVSHDLKNPLGVILLCASRLLEAPTVVASRDAQRSVEMLQRAASSMKSLILDLLDVAALDGGAMSIRPGPLDAATIVRDAVDALRPIAAQCEVALSMAPSPALPPIWADRQRVMQVLVNLLSNAIKFTPAGGSVVVRLDAEHEMVAFTVADTGSGIPATDLCRVFDRFLQASDTRKLGTGLGLSICRSLVELSGGSISATSELGAGTSMRFTLPCAASCDDALAACHARG